MKTKPNIKVGHIHLTVADLDRSVQFYRDLLGFEITARIGDSAVFLSSDGYHHHIGLNTWAGTDAKPAPIGHTGMYHVAFLYPDRKALATVLQKLKNAHYPLEGASDHGVSEAIYLRDPDQNGIEIYVDRPKNTWDIDANGMYVMTSKALNLEKLLLEAE